MQPRRFSVPSLAARRGAADRAPENTIAAFELAAAAGACFVTVDARLSADGALVCLHDATLERTTSGSGPVSSLTRAQLLALDAGAWFADEFTGEPVPALDELLPVLEELDLGVILELRADDDAGARAVAEAFAALAEAHAADAHAPAWPEALLLASEHAAALEQLHARLPQLPRALVSLRPEPDTLAVAQRCGCRSVQVDHRSLRREFVNAAREAGLRVDAFTVNDTDRAEQLWDVGIRSVFTEVPDLPAVPTGGNAEEPDDDATAPA